MTNKNKITAEKAKEVIGKFNELTTEVKDLKNDLKSERNRNTKLQNLLETHAVHVEETPVEKIPTREQLRYRKCGNDFVNSGRSILGGTIAIATGVVQFGQGTARIALTTVVYTGEGVYKSAKVTANTVTKPFRKKDDMLATVTQTAPSPA